jgi:hypothetical protein
MRSVGHFRFSRILLVLTIALAALGDSCQRTPVTTGDTSVTSEINVNGTVRFIDLEGGFWTVRGDDGLTYDPVGGLPKDFQQEGLRVHLVARPRPDLMSTHMAGRLVEIVSLRRLS